MNVHVTVLNIALALATLVQVGIVLACARQAQGWVVKREVGPAAVEIITCFAGVIAIIAIYSLFQ